MYTFEYAKQKFEKLYNERKNLERLSENTKSEILKQTESIQLYQSNIESNTSQIEKIKKDFHNNLNLLLTDENILINTNTWTTCSTFNLNLDFLNKIYRMFKQNHSLTVPAIKTKEELIGAIEFKIGLLEFNTEMEKLNSLYLMYVANPDAVKNNLLKSYNETQIKKLTEQLETVNSLINTNVESVRKIRELDNGCEDVKNTLMSKIFRRKKLENQRRINERKETINRCQDEQIKIKKEIKTIQENPNLYLEFIETQLTKLEQFIKMYQLIQSAHNSVTYHETIISKTKNKIDECSSTIKQHQANEQEIIEKLKINEQQIYDCCKEIALDSKAVNKLYQIAENKNNDLYPTDLMRIKVLIEYYETYIANAVNELTN